MKIHSVVLATLLASTFVAACNVESSDSTGGGLTPTPGVTVPCLDAVLHSRQPYTACVAGLVTNMEQDNWCCPDGTMPTTDSSLGSTDVSCGDAGSPADGGEQVAPTASDAGASNGQGGSIGAGAGWSCCAPAASKLAASLCPGGQCCLAITPLECTAGGGVFQASCTETPPSC
jgi:hypothetical protein